MSEEDEFLEAMKDPNIEFPPRDMTGIPDYDEWRRSEWKVKKVDYVPTPTDQKIIDTYLKVNPTLEGRGSKKHIVEIVAESTGAGYERTEEVIKKGLLRELGKQQKKEIQEKVYGDKIEVAEEIVGLSLVGLRDWVRRKVDIGIDSTDDAKAILSITTGLHTLLRLELGKSTQNVEVVQTVHKDVSVVLDDLRKKDPFRTYPTLQNIEEEESGSSTD